MNRRFFFRTIFLPLLGIATSFFSKIVNADSISNNEKNNRSEKSGLNSKVTNEYNAGDVNFNPLLNYPAGSLGKYITAIPGADNKGINNSLTPFNDAILNLAINGGGVLRPEPGVYLISEGSILLPSEVILELYGCHLYGDGDNIIIMSAAVIESSLKEIVSEYGSRNTGNGDHFVGAAGIRGGRLSNASVGVRAHRFNYGSTIEHVTFDSSLDKSLVSSHSWGLKFSNNTVLSPAIMKDFVDWTEISGNNFEGNSKYDDGYVGLTITSEGFGGSYSARIINNGFHRMHQGISIECESANMVIESNHFEAVINHIVGSKLLNRNFRIKNNWMKANLTKFDGGKLVTPMLFSSLINSEVGPNFFSTDGLSIFAKHIIANTNDCYGNIYMIGYSTDNSKIFEMISLSETNQVTLMNGGNDSRTSQPCIDIRSGSGVYTFEKYKSSYNKIKNKIPFCNVEQQSNNTIIKTWMVWDNGCSSFCIFDVLASSELGTFRIAGTFCLDVLNITVNKKIGVESSTIDVVLKSSDDGFVIISLAGDFSVSGWVKEL